MNLVAFPTLKQSPKKDIKKKKKINDTQSMIIIIIIIIEGYLHFYLIKTIFAFVNRVKHAYIYIYIYQSLYHASIFKFINT